MSRYKTLNREITAITLEVARNGKVLEYMVAEKRQHFNAANETTFEPSTEVAIRESARQDVYVFFSGLLDAETAVLHIHFNPLVVWVWMGGFIMAFGGIIVMWPQAERRERGYVAELAPQHEGALAGAGA